MELCDVVCFAGSIVYHKIEQKFYFLGYFKVFHGKTINWGRSYHVLPVSFVLKSKSTKSENYAEVFDYKFRNIGGILQKSEANYRELYFALFVYGNGRFIQTIYVIAGKKLKHLKPI